MSDHVRPPAPELSPDELLTVIEFRIHEEAHS
jgi:hypothetical protein